MVDPKRILVVDSEPVSLRHTAESLGQRAACIGVQTAQEALRALAAERFDLVLLELSLSDLTGLGLLRLIRTFAGLFASNFLPTTVRGDVVRLAGSLRLEGSAVLYAASIAVDRLVGMPGMVSAAPLGLPAFLPWLKAGGAAATGPFSVSGVVTGWGTLRQWLQRSMSNGLGALRLGARQPQWLAGAFGCTWVYMLLKFAALALFFRSLGAPIPFTEVAGLWSLVYFITLVPISIGGLVLQEVSAS